MATGSSHVPFSFVARWIRWVRAKSDTTKRHEIDFSEGLLKTLYYETDIGSIPRGADTADAPKYKNNPNWNKRISGCYWCLRDRTLVQGICCSKECIYYLHEWCVERVELFQKRRFCKRPGCDKSPTQQDYNCCCLTHHKEYSELYNWIGKQQLNGLIAKGPGWYNKELSFSSDTQLTQTNPFTSTNSHISGLTQTNPFTSSVLISDSTTMDLATELKTSLVFYTDVGPIPRSYKKAEHSVSQHSNSINWRADITGCYQCGRPVTERDEYLCSEKCYLVFNEWCRLKVVDAIKIEFCDYPGCGKQPMGGYSTCSKEHFRKRNTYLDSNEYYKSVQKGPHWYRGTHSSSSSDMSTTTHQSRTPSCHDNPVNPSNPSHPYIVTHLFSRTLTEWMYKESDIGPIPRSLLQIDYIGDKNKPTASNWNAIIPHCYWCCAGSTLHVQGIACSEQCFFLFNEWCHMKYNKATFKQLCKFLHCGNSLSSKKDCCYEHTSKYSSYTQRFGNQLKSSDFALGPKWYSNKSVKHIDFYNREDPFYEFTNFFPCSKLFIDGKVWKTTEHYFQAQKFTGTPHVECVRIMSTPRETFEYTRRSSVQKWIRPDWAVVKERIMLKALEAKFNQNECLAQLLIRTGDMQLYEHTRNDKFWGDGGDRKGENKLGKLLMQVRFDMQGRCPFLPSRLDHILLTSHPLPHAPNISSSPGSNLCTPRAGGDLGRRTDPQGRGTDPQGRGTGPQGRGTDPQGRGADPQGRGTDPQGRGTDPQGRGADPQGRRTDPQGRGTDPQGRRTDPQGRGADPQGRGTDPQGRGADPQGRGTDPQGRGTDPQGRGADPQGRGTDPQGRGADPQGRRTDHQGRGADPQGRGTDPQGRGADPQGRGTDPQGRGADPQGRGTDPQGRGADFQVRETGAPSVPYGASLCVHTSLQSPFCQIDSLVNSISNSDTDDTISSNGTNGIPDCGRVMFSNYGPHDIQNSSSKLPAGSSTSSQTGDYSKEQSPQLKTSVSVTSLVSHFEKNKLSTQQNHVGTNTHDLYSQQINTDDTPCIYPAQSLQASTRMRMELHYINKNN